MARRLMNRRELRAEAEAAEALGLNQQKPGGRTRGGGGDGTSGVQPATASPRSPSRSAGRAKVVWEVCDVGGRAVATFEYAHKADAEAHLAALLAKGKGTHFLRSTKQPMNS